MINLGKKSKSTEARHLFNSCEKVIQYKVM